MRFRVYTDTSVIGGCADVEFAEESLRFIELARSGRLILLISDVVVRELMDAPEPVSQLLKGLPEDALDPEQANLSS
jgi:hypothetical protein